MTDIPEGCTPFDLEKAKAGAKVMYANGEEVAEFHVWGSGEISSRREIDGAIIYHRADGKRPTLSESYNLVMAPPPMKKATYWAVPESEGAFGFRGGFYETEHQAKQEALLGGVDLALVQPVTIKVPV